MKILNCQKDGKFSWNNCAKCTSRECEQPQFEEMIIKYKKAHPQKTWQSCVVCGHARGLEVFDERPAHPDYWMFCKLHQCYIKTHEGLCGYHCL